MEQIIEKKSYEFSKTGEIIQTILIILATLLIPAVIPQLLQAIFGKTSPIASNSQLIVGSIVNTALIMTAINIKGWRNIILISILPSISAVSSGLIFGSLTPVTVYMIPGIWLGNFSLIILMKYLYASKKLNYIKSSAISILVKVGIIFATLNIWIALSVLPGQGSIADTLKNAMGLTQLITATIGSIISILIIKFGFQNQMK